MGGMGAVKSFAKFPELFSVCVEYDGALLTWADITRSHAAVATAVFGDTESYWDQYSHWTWCTTNAATLRQGTNIRMIAGALVNGNRRFRDFLTSLQIPFEYVETGCAHTIPCVLAAEGASSASFIARRLIPFVQSRAGCSSQPVTFSVFAAGPGTLTYQWQLADITGAWVDLQDGPITRAGGIASIANGAHASDLQLSTWNANYFDPAPPGSNGHRLLRLRCIVTGCDGIAVSNEATFTAEACRCGPCDIADDAGHPLMPWNIEPDSPNNGVTEGDYNLFFATFFDAGPACDIANDDGSPLPPFGTPETNNGVTEGDYNIFFAVYFNGCAL